MNTNNPLVSRVALTFEMLICFGFLSMVFFSFLIRVENNISIMGGFRVLFFLCMFLVGPIGLIFGFRLIVLKRTYMSKAMIAALIILGAWTLILNGIVLWIDAATPGHPWGFWGALGGVILPVLGVAHLIYMSNPEEKMNMPV